MRTTIYLCIAAFAAAIGFEYLKVRRAIANPPWNEPMPPVAEAYVISEKEQFVTRDLWFGNDPYRNQRLIDDYFNDQSNVLFVVITSTGPIECRRR